MDSNEVDYLSLEQKRDLLKRLLHEKVATSRKDERNDQRRKRKDWSRVGGATR